MAVSESKAAPQLTTHPYIGIVGVFLGAGIATLNARLVSVGLADLRGALGLGFDEASRGRRPRSTWRPCSAASSSSS